MGAIVLMTMTFYDYRETLRMQLALRTAEEAHRHGLPLVILDGGSHETFVDALLARPLATVSLHQQMAIGMGIARRELYRRALDYGDEDTTFIWLEAEKWPLVSQCRKIAEPIIAGQADFVVPSRTDTGWASYPPEQQLSEKLGNLAWWYLTGHAVDIFWGPFAANREALQHFIEYSGEYGDRWDAHFIPRLRVLAAGLRVVGVYADYRHPAEQTAAEAGDLQFVIKRIEQLWNQVPTVVAEAKKLGFHR